MSFSYCIYFLFCHIDFVIMRCRLAWILCRLVVVVSWFSEVLHGLRRSCCVFGVSGLGGCFGFLLGLIPTAWVIGKIAEKDRSVPRLLLACFAGLAVLYLVGLPYIALIVNVYKGGNVSGMTLATAYMLPYLPGDCLKIVVSVILAPRILKAMERNS